MKAETLSHAFRLALLFEHFSTVIARPIRGVQRVGRFPTRWHAQATHEDRHLIPRQSLGKLIREPASELSKNCMSQAGEDIERATHRRRSTVYIHAIPARHSPRNLPDATHHPSTHQLLDPPLDDTARLPSKLRNRHTSFRTDAVSLLAAHLIVC